MSSNGKHPEQPSIGGQGELLDPHHVRGDLGLLRRAIRNRWPVSSFLRSKVVERMEQILEKSDDERNTIAAARVLVTADRVNLAATELVMPKTVQHEHSGSIGLVAIREELLNDPDLIDFRRRQALECDTDPGAVCEVRQPGEVENGKAPGGPGQGTNGHSNGRH